MTNLPRWAAFSSDMGRIRGTPGTGDVGTYSDIVIQVSDGKQSTVLAAVLDRGSREGRDQHGTDYCGQSPKLRHARSALRLHTNGQRCGQRRVDLHDRQPAVLGHLQQHDWPVERHAEREPRRLVQQHHDSCERWRGYRSVGLFQHHGDGRTASSATTAPEQTADDLGNPGRPRSPRIRRTVFTPSANDADGDTLTFTISNRPSWATFNGTTGRLSGTPGASHVGGATTTSRFASATARRRRLCRRSALRSQPLRRRRTRRRRSPERRPRR